MTRKPVKIATYCPAMAIVNEHMRVFSQRVNTPWLSACCQAVNKLSGWKNIFCPNTFSRVNKPNNTKIPKNRNRRKFSSGCQEAVKKLSRSCQEAVRRLSGKNHHNFEAKIKFGRWFRYHRRAYSAPSMLTPAKFDLHFRLSRGCSPSVFLLVEDLSTTQDRQ